MFFSSTFTDSTEERNHVAKAIFPELRELLTKQYGYEFQLVDMRWGITDSATSKNITTDICLNEIRSCRDESSGPFFMGFLSHKYGNKFLLPAIAFNEFKALKNEILTENFDNCFTGACVSTNDLIGFCYKLDENQVPSVFRLLSIEDIIEGYNPDVSVTLN